MALNQREINDDAVNAGPVQKSLFLTAVVYANQIYYYLSGAINSFSLNVNAIDSTPTASNYVNATITIQLTKAVSLLTTLTSTVTVISGKAYLKVLSIVSASTVSLIKAVSKLINATSTSTTSVVKAIGKY